MVTGDEVILELAERAGFDLRPRLAHQREVKMQVMQAQEPQAEDFLRLDEMPYVAAGKPGASGSGFAVGIDFPVVALERFIPQADQAAAGKGGPVAGDPGWQHAIEHVHSARNHFQELGEGCRRP